MRMVADVTRAVVAAIVLTVGQARALPEKTVAITFDDLPYAGAVGHEASALSPRDVAALNQRVLEVLRGHHAPAIGFAVETAIQALGVDFSKRLLADWTGDGFALGNHTYSHADSNSLGLEAIKAEIEKGEATIKPLMEAADMPLRFIRFPMNHTGDTSQKRDAIAAFLAERDYDLAASTIDTSDYVFERAYTQALADGALEHATKIKTAYLTYTSTQIDYYAALNADVLGYEPPEIMLLHLNRLNADSLDQILRLFERKGYRFVTLAAAQSDPAYLSPSSYATDFGPMWGYRWARDRSVRIDGSREQEPPDWVVHYPDGQAD